jgi:hypothetical protein
MRKCFILFLFSSVLLLAGCTRHTGPGTVPHNCTSAVQHRPAPVFNRLVIKGNINVSLSTGCAKPRVILRGDPRDFVHVKTHGGGGSYNIVPGKGYPKCAMHVEVCTHYLNYFSYHGNGVVNAGPIHSSLLDVIIDNSGKTTMHGNLGIRQLEIKGTGITQISGLNARNLQLKIVGKPKVQLEGAAHLSSLNIGSNAFLSLFWVKANQLIIRQHGSSIVQLAGVVDKLDLELRGSSRFRGRHLRANTAFVKTFGSSLAEVSAVKRQHTLASGASDIHFFNLPELKTDFMAYNGAVLDMRDWNDPFMQEYDQYNKTLFH